MVLLRSVGLLPVLRRVIRWDCLHLGGWVRTVRPALWPSGGFLALAMLLPFLLFVFTMPTGVVLEDDGLFLMNGVFLGVQHPPGYPVFTIIHHGFQQLPFWSAAVKGHLLSALFGVLTCGVLYAIARRLGVGVVNSLLAAWMLAVCEHFWSQAIITEVYTLHVLLFFSIAYCMVAIWREPSRAGPWFLVAAFYGLGLANNWPLMVLSAPALLVGLWPVRRELRRRLAALSGVFAAFVGIPYVWLYFYSYSEPDFAFGGSMADPVEFLAFLARRLYVSTDVHTDWGLDDFAGYIGWFSWDLLYQTAFLGGFLAFLVIVWVALPRGWLRLPEPGLVYRRFLAFGVVAFLCNSVLLLLFLRNEYDDYGVSVFSVYPLVCYGLLAVWFGLGLKVVSDSATFSLRRVASAVPFGAVVAGLVGVALVSVSLILSWDQGDRRGDKFADLYADYVFSSVPDDSTLLVGGDLSTHVLGYRHFVEGDRADLRLVSVDGLVFPTNYVKLSSYDGWADVNRGVHAGISDSEEDVYWAHSLGFPVFTGYNLSWNGPSTLLSKDASLEMSVLDDSGLQYGEWLMGLWPEDGTELYYRNVLLFVYCSGVPLEMYSGDYGRAQAVSGFFEQALGDPFCLQGIAYGVLDWMAGDLYEATVGSGVAGGHEIFPVVDFEVVDGWLNRISDLRSSGEFGDYSSFDDNLDNSFEKLRLLQGHVDDAAG